MVGTSRCDVRAAFSGATYNMNCTSGVVRSARSYAGGNAASARASLRVSVSTSQLNSIAR